MPKKIFFDIETLPPADDEREYYRAQYEEYLQQHSYAENLPTFDRYFRELALDAATGRLLTIGLIVEENGAVTHNGCLGRDRVTGMFHLDEARTLGAFWKLLRSFNPYRDLLVAHNALNFDLLFLLRRSAVCGVKPPFDFGNLNKYKCLGVYDTMWEWTNKQKAIKLERLASAFKLPNPKNGDVCGATVYDAFQAGRDLEIAVYCAKDVECLRQIYYRMNFQISPTQFSGDNNLPVINSDNSDSALPS